MINSLSSLKKNDGSVRAIVKQRQRMIKNSSDNIAVTGTKYYVSSNGDDSFNGTSPSSPWRTLLKLKENRGLLKNGDGVFFERGSVFRQENTVYDELYKNNCVLAVSGVTYGAYGKGAKPLFLGSSFNYADVNWQLHSKNIWKTDLPLQDAGIIVFDDGKFTGVKKSSVDELCLDHEFYHDTDSGVFYLYLSKGSPTEVFNDIEIGCNRPVFLFVGNVGNVTIDNLDIRYVGGHAISGYEFNHDIIISNCELSWIGGSWQNKNVVRYGNAVQFWDSCSDIVITDCYVHQVYDAGLTFQGPNGAEYKNISFRNNLIQYCNYCIEFFIQGKLNNEGKRKANGILENIEFSNNIFRFSGYGICEQRPDKEDSSFICGWTTDVDNRLDNVSITNNVFDSSYKNIVYWLFENTAGVNVSGNKFYKCCNKSENVFKYGPYGQITSNNKNQLFDAVHTFDSNPAEIVWIGT